MQNKKVQIMLTKFAKNNSFKRNPNLNEILILVPVKFLLGFVEAPLSVFVVNRIINMKQGDFALATFL